MNRLVSALLIVSLLLVSAPGALALGGDLADGPDASEFDGYIVRVEPGTDPARGDGPEKFAEDLYIVEDIRDAAAAFDREDVVYIEPNYIATVFESEPDDLYYAEQWALPAIQAPAIWDEGITGDGVRIGLIDSGITMDHEDLNYDYIAPGKNYRLGEDPADVSDLSTKGHGSAVAGILGAVRDNGVGIAGLLDEAILVPLKVVDENSATVIDIYNAIIEAVDVFRCDVINMSLGFYGDEREVQTIQEAVAYAASKDVLMVAASGNDGRVDGMPVCYPAGFDEVVSVSAVDRDGGVPDFSQHNDQVFVAAPGKGIVTISNKQPNGYEYKDGTSFSAPYVSAMAAVAKSVHHDMTVEEFKALLEASAVDAGEPGRDEYYGYGVVDIAAFIDLLPESNWEAGFRDITGHWALDSIVFGVDQGLFNGKTSYLFEPDDQMTRAMFVTVLGRLYEGLGGTVEAGTVDAFSDTRDNEWYSKYVTWASENQIVQGYDNGRFGPDDSITREQIATVLYRFAEMYDVDMSGDPDALNGFTDWEEIEQFAREAMAWAISQELINGFDEGGAYLYPDSSASRAQVATIIYRFYTLYESTYS